MSIEHSASIVKSTQDINGRLGFHSVISSVSMMKSHKKSWQSEGQGRGQP